MTLPALKERAGVVAALAAGAQTLLVRGPGRAPDTDTAPFFLYPAYAHQRPERYSDDRVSFYEATREKPEEGIPIMARAEVVAEYTVPSDSLDALAERYVYTAGGLREKYGIEETARVLLLRVASLTEPHLIEERAAYRGCRRWIELEDERLDAVETEPVLGETAFAERRESLEATLSTDVTHP